jgi:hypothetical protein
MVLGYHRQDEHAVSRQIFRSEALRRHAMRASQSRRLDLPGRMFAVLWSAAAVLALVLSLLTWLVLRGGA